MKKIGQILKWIPPAFFALLILAGGASAIFFSIGNDTDIAYSKTAAIQERKAQN